MASEDGLETLMARIPTHQPATNRGVEELKCCCGRTDCAFLAHNCSALDDLEREVRTAAQLGQALLVRHEAYMVDAEHDRLDMSAKISKLESDKRDLEAENARTFSENRDLLDQLEASNSRASESEAHIKALEATLHSTNQELRRLEGLASRTHSLETQLAALEQEQEILQKTIVTTEADERSAIQRWRKAERRLHDLQDQLERIEREAREERERHVEVLGRMERQRVVERELDTAAGRLKGAAAATVSNGKNGSNVVSHFVKDILQDNANLQLGIVELREMLMNSNDEVQALREQLLIHQPMQDDNGDNSGPPTLRAELAPEEEPEPQVISQALHIHHHYHAPKKEEMRRPKKKRTSINTSLFTPPKNIHASNNPGRNQETASTILSQTSVTVPSPIAPNQRWSIQSAHMSDFAASSVPSSPQSMYRNSTLFDRGYDLDSSRPTSPTSSIDPMSPQFQPYHRKRGSEVSTRSSAAPMNFQPNNVIHEEENSDVEEIQNLQTPRIPSLADDITPSDTSHDPGFVLSEQWEPQLRRSTSHESILSIGGLDIHTLKSRSSQLTIKGSGAILRRPTRLDTPTSTMSIDTLTSSSMITARPTLSRQGHDSTLHLRSSIGTAHSPDARSINSSSSNEGASLGKKVGGWVFGRWGFSPMKSSGDLREARAQHQKRVVSTPAPIDPLQAVMGRSPGVNQSGPIPGFVRKDKGPPSQVRPVVVDRDALRDVLMEGALP